jgi:hypothetical protein
MSCYLISKALESIMSSVMRCYHTALQHLQHDIDMDHYVM